MRCTLFLQLRRRLQQAAQRSGLRCCGRCARRRACMPASPRADVRAAAAAGRWWGRGRVVVGVCAVRVGAARQSGALRLRRGTLVCLWRCGGLSLRRGARGDRGGAMRQRCFRAWLQAVRHTRHTMHIAGGPRRNTRQARAAGAGMFVGGSAAWGAHITFAYSVTYVAQRTSLRALLVCVLVRRRGVFGYRAARQYGCESVRGAVMGCGSARCGESRHHGGAARPCFARRAGVGLGVVAACCGGVVVVVVVGAAGVLDDADGASRRHRVPVPCGATC